MLKLIAGSFRQRQLMTPKGDATRPTSGIVRGAVFNRCQHHIEGARCLDLCAGSGAIGLEALSRGAAHVHFVENQLEANRCLKANIATLGVAAQTTLFYSDALKTLRLLEKLEFDFIYIDPPYNQFPLINALLATIDKKGLLSQQGMLFIETNSTSDGWPPLQTLFLESSRNYGGTSLHCFMRANTELGL